MNSSKQTVSSRVLNLSPSSMELSQVSQLSVTVPFCCLQYKFDTNLYCPAYTANIFICVCFLVPNGTTKSFRVEAICILLLCKVKLYYILLLYFFNKADEQSTFVKYLLGHPC